MWSILLSALFLLLSPKFSENTGNTKPYIVFDIGGVVAFHNHQKIEAFISDKLHIDLSQAHTALEMWKKASVQGVSPDAFWKSYAEAHHLALPGNWALELQENLPFFVEEIPGVISIILDLNEQGYHTAVLSNTRPFKALSFKKRGIYDPFSTVVLCYKSDEKKPSTKSFEKLLEKLNAQSSHCLLIDDKEAHIQKAKELGFDTILFTSTKQLAQELEKRGIRLNSR